MRRSCSPVSASRRRSSLAAVASALSRSTARRSSAVRHSRHRLPRRLQLRRDPRVLGLGRLELAREAALLLRPGIVVAFLRPSGELGRPAARARPTPRARPRRGGAGAARRAGARSRAGRRARGRAAGACALRSRSASFLAKVSSSRARAAATLPSPSSCFARSPSTRGELLAAREQAGRPERSRRR